MSDEIKHAGIKGYVIMGGVVAFLLFVVLVIYLYKANQAFVPEDPELYGTLINGMRGLWG
ncbi:hypothetical protein CLV84_1497 [Neolewinella xylanilytica]|uniref:Uncharacterized protein n=1 Tax=Neolewinella xylanilytica TaxID=1514080 RepID=A0A2S6IAP5_9BACT|nr:hypothetical protein [Neolewinella xylanilytica]PPK88529.1 hypothetical protein CLV84_1497 [Neolewinella xylanilytica]